MIILQKNLHNQLMWFMYIFFCNACHLIIPARVTRPIKESNYDYDPGHRNNFYVLKSHLYTCIFHFLDLKYKKNTYIACRIRHKKHHIGLIKTSPVIATSQVRKLIRDWKCISLSQWMASCNSKMLETLKVMCHFC